MASKKASLVLSPSAIEFEDCEVGKSYSANLEIRNAGTSSVSLRFRVPKPPTCFAVRLPSDALVAPGMSRSIRIDVSVASSQDVAEELVVVGPPDTVVPLRVWRNRPQLQLPEPLNCGHCVVGATKRYSSECWNVGRGRGRFVVMAQADSREAEALLALEGDRFDSAFSAAFDKAALASPDVNCGEFSVAPRTFSLVPGQAVSISAVFSPSSPRRQDCSLIVVSDSRQRRTLEIVGNGCLPSIHMYGADGIVSADQLSLLFDPEGAGSMEKSIRIKNVIAVPMNFRWQLSAMPFHSRSGEGDVSPSATSAAPAAQQVVPFDVVPQSGTLLEMADASFTVHFKPPSQGTFNAVASLLVQEIPRCLASQCPGMIPGDSALADVVIFRVGMKGICPAPRVAIEPALIFVPVLLSQGEEFSQPVSLNNSGSFPVRYEISGSFPGLVVKANPAGGTIPAQGRALLAVSVSIPRGRTATEPPCSELKVGLFSLLEPFVSLAQLTLPISLGTKKAALSLEPRFVEFGLVQVGQCQKRSVRVCSGPDHSGPVSWRLRTVGENTADISICKPSGVLSPGQAEDAEICFQPRAPQQSTLSVELLTGDAGVAAGETHVKACADFPMVVVDNCQVDLGSIDAEKEAPFHVVLRNISGIGAHFSWREKDTPDVSASFRPRDGMVPAFGSVDVLCSFKAKVSAQSQRYTATFACLVDGMPVPAGIAVSYRLKGLAVRCYLLASGASFELPLGSKEAAPSLPFPPSIPILAPVTTDIELINTSSLDTAISISSDKYPCQRLTEHHRTSGGLSVVSSPSTFLLKTGTKQTVRVTCFADMPGSFVDSFAIECDGPRTVLPLRIQAVGSPLTIQSTSLGLDSHTTPPSLSWGTVSPGPPIQQPQQQQQQQQVQASTCRPSSKCSKRPRTPPGNTRRIFKLANSSSYEVAIRWRFETAAGGVTVSPPFSALPASLVVPALGNAEASFMFSSPEIADFRWRAIGEARPIIEPGKPSANLDLPPVVLDLLAQTVQPHLEFKPDKRLEFIVPAAALTDPQPQVQQLTVTNPLHFAFEFSVDVDPPVLFAMQLPKDLTSPSDGVFLLPPGKSSSIGFELNTRALLVAGPTPEDSDTTASAKFTFSNEGTQSFQIVAKLRHAKLACPGSVDFGPVPTGETRTLMFAVNNLTQIGAHWMLVSSPTEAFTFQPSSGFSAGNGQQPQDSAGLSNVVHVTFSPKKIRQYETTVRILPEHAAPVQVVIKGNGQYNERLL